MATEPTTDRSEADEHLIRLQLERLAMFERTCDILWPAIRFFGLTGAHPQYAIASIEIGRLLGYVKDDAPQVDVEALAVAVRQETIEAVAAWAAEAQEISSVAGRKFQAELADRIRKLPIQ